VTEGVVGGSGRNLEWYTRAPNPGRGVGFEGSVWKFLDAQRAQTDHVITVGIGALGPQQVSSSTVIKVVAHRR